MPRFDYVRAQSIEHALELMLEGTGRRWSTEYKEVAIRALAERTLRRVFAG